MGDSTIANEDPIESLSKLNAQLREALDSREVIGEAKGIIMERERGGSEAAFDILNGMSQRSNRKLRDIAKDIVDSVERRKGG